MLRMCPRCRGFYFSCWFTDPGEVNNLLGLNGPSASHVTVGKAEHLKALLVEWMKRMDGDEKFYSDNKYHL